jgi:hypothetical protein
VNTGTDGITACRDTGGTADAFGEYFLIGDMEPGKRESDVSEQLDNKS